MIPKLHRKFWVGAADDGNKMILNFRIMRSAALRRCMFWGANWKSIESEVIMSQSMADASLSSRWSDGLSPRVLSSGRIIF